MPRHDSRLTSGRARLSFPRLPDETPPRLSLILPAYREERALSTTLAAARSHLESAGHGYEMLVAVDGQDGTRAVAEAEAARDSRVVVLAAAQRRGKGRAIREAVARARGQVIGFMDGDGKVPMEAMESVLPWLESGFDVVIGSRRASGARIQGPRPLHRRLASPAFNGLVRLLLRPLRDVADTQCGFKFFRAAVARDLFARQHVDGYMFDVEVLLLAVASGYRLKQVGLPWRDDGDSRLDLLSGNWRNLVDLLRIRARTAKASQSTNTSSRGAERNA